MTIAKPAPPKPPAPKPPAPVKPNPPKVDVQKPVAPKVPDKVELPQAPAGQPVVSVPTKKPHKKKGDDIDGLDFVWILLGILIAVIVVSWIFSRD